MLRQLLAEQALLAVSPRAAGPWPPPTVKAEDPERAAIKPMIPAASTIIGNGTPLKKIATKAMAASAIIGPLLSARLPTR